MKNTQKDWHPADIIAALHKRRISLAALSRSSGLASSTLANALSRPWPKGEWLIARALHLHPATIWPSRYAGQEDFRLPKYPLPNTRRAESCYSLPEKHYTL